MSKARQAAFTLIEVMVVLVIIGIATAAITLSLGAAGDRPLREEAWRLALALQAAQSVVHADGRPIRWYFDGRGYQFIRERNDNFIRDPLLKPQHWENAALQVQVSPQQVVLLDAEWISTPLRIELSDGANRVSVVRHANGAVTVQ
ncbi:prepilin-type N-terminal cleavage/methylation domain-containing protein [Pseudomonas huanghezhanensis]|uniref:prepilin-type N-terminal cleavage/methylation domain-containing protein n=1 Tax=Pseudomonas huanghezhanensis TaxID=3002903 RepID=UPI0022861BA6|nr:prepilin-type N-terminal cleavage/methylation domain-containing protein [Pseudomonas sp. BSw22131]